MKTTSTKSEKATLTREIKEVESYLADLQKALHSPTPFYLGDRVTPYKVAATEGELVKMRMRRQMMDFSKALFTH